MLIRVVGKQRSGKTALAWSVSTTLVPGGMKHGGCNEYSTTCICRRRGNVRRERYSRTRCHGSVRKGPTKDTVGTLSVRPNDGYIKEFHENRTHAHDSVTTYDAYRDVRIASVSRLALYSSGGQLGSHKALQMRGSMYQQTGPNTISITAGRPVTSIIPSILVIAMTFGTVVLAAVRSKVKAVRDCTSCQGYGVLRCKLCSGKGTIDWEGKMAHREPCPMCLGRRLIKCKTCGGSILFSRSLFIHKANKGEEALMETLQTLRTPSMRLFGSKNSEQDARLAESDEYSKEILSD